MARKHQTAYLHPSHTRSTLLSCIAVGFVMMIAIASGLAYSMHEKAVQRASVRTEQSNGATSNSASTTPDIVQTNQEQVETMPSDNNTSSPAESNHSSSTTTVTVNGETVTVDGNGTYRRNVVSENGRSTVDIKVKNNNKQESKSN